MDIPDLVRRKLGDEEIQAGVSLGDEDAVCLTPTRTLVYRGEGLLSDEQVEEYPHDVERIAVSEGRRKTKFTLQYIDGTKSFSVPANRGDKVLELFLEGVLRLDEVVDRRESVVGVFRFSELTVIITEGRLIKHIGEHVWDDDYEVFPYEDVTRLEFERASVATSISLSVDGRPQRVKVPNDQAPMVRQTLEKALFNYYDVGSLEELNRTAGDAEPDGPATDDEGDAEFEFGDDFDPLVTEDDDEELTESVDTDDALAERGAGTESGSPATGATGGTSGAAPAERGEPEAADGPIEEPSDAPSGTDPGRAPTTDEIESNHAEGDASAGEEQVTSQVTDDESVTTSERAEPDAPAGTESANAGTDPAADEWASKVDDAGTDPGGAAAVGREEFDALADRVEDLTEAVERQNELLRRQHRAIKQLVQQQSDD